jgi:hypothetical protein
LVLTSLAWGASSLKSELGLGADYSNQRYAAFSLDTALLVRDTTNRDTLAVDTEGKTSFGLSLNLDSDHAQLDAVNTLNLSTLSIRDILNLTAEQELAARLKLQASYGGEVRYYHRAFPQLGDTSYRRDYWNHNGRVTLKYNPSDRLGISVGDALEYLHYPKPDAYSYDYLLNRARVSLSSDLGDLSALDVEYDWSKRWAIQADSQDYDDHSLQAGFNGYFGANWHLKLDTD